MEISSARVTVRMGEKYRLARLSGMRETSATCGIRPIFIVDITFYVMEEYGQPMHARSEFMTCDGLRCVKMQDGDLPGLDGREKLDNAILVIATAGKRVGIRPEEYLMGGRKLPESPVMQNTAILNPHASTAHIRPPRKVGLNTDAGSEKVSDPNNNAGEAVNPPAS